MVDETMFAVASSMEIFMRDNFHYQTSKGEYTYCLKETIQAQGLAGVAMRYNRCAHTFFSAIYRR